MRISSLAGAITAIVLSLSAGLAGAATLGTPSPAPTNTSFAFHSTNADNFTDGTNWVELVSSGPGSVELKFVNQNTYDSYYEYRVDGAAATSATPHYLLKDFVGDDSLYSFYYVAANTTRTETISALNFVDIRHAFGPEQDRHFDWTRFESQPAAVPLPAALPLLLAAFGGLGLAARKRKTA